MIGSLTIAGAVICLVVWIAVLIGRRCRSLWYWCWGVRMGKNFTYVDNSNVFIEGQRVSAVTRGQAESIFDAMERRIIDSRWRLDYGALHDIACGQPAEIGASYLWGSPPPGDSFWRMVERYGFRVTTYDRNIAGKEKRFLTQMYARFSPRRVRHRSGKTPRMCPCPVRSGAVVCRSVDGRLRGPALGGGPARRQPDQTQAADSMALTWRRTVKASGTRPRLSPTFYARAEPSLTVQPPWSWQPRHDSAVCCGRTFREPATALQIRAVFFSHVSH